ncbi:MAG: leucine-rich repeat protein, partial [Ruminococcus sp.]
IMSKAFSGCDSVQKVVVTAGTGQMTNYSSDPLLLDKDNSFMQTPWYKTKEKVEVVLCNGVNNVGNYAFYRCSNVQSVTIPKTVNSLGVRAFYLNKALQSIVVSPDNQLYCDVDGVLYSKDKSTLIVYPSGKNETSYDIIDKTINISDYAFCFCQNLKMLNLSDSLSEMGTLSIYDCETLKEVNAPENNETYCSSDGVLYSKDKSTLVYYPSGKNDKEFSVLSDVVVIGERAVCFTKLESIDIPQGVTQIGSYAFYSNRSVSEIVIPNSVKYIDNDAFYLCTSLVKITVCSYDCEFNGKTIPDSVTIHTCTGSTAQAYAEKYGNPVVSIGHNYVDRVESSSCTGEGYVIKVCTVCGDSYATDEVKTAGHQYTENVISPTCTQQGYTVFTCSKCDDVYIDNYTNPLEHNVVTDKAIPSTCKNDGKTEGSHCSRCNKVFVAQETVKATGHSYDNGIVKIKATCTESGKKVFTCKKCSYSYSKTIAATGHNYRTRVTMATFDKSGSSVTYCSICGIVKSKKPIAKIKTVQLSKISYTYTGKYLTKPTVTVKDS